MTSARRGDERRKWSRLALAIPVFVRARDEQGKEILEFATALNVSAGGMLIAVRKALHPAALITLEIPSPPMATLSIAASASRNLRAKALRSTHEAGYYLLGVKFSRPLGASTVARQRKVLATV